MSFGRTPRKVFEVVGLLGVVGAWQGCGGGELVEEHPPTHVTCTADGGGCTCQRTDTGNETACVERPTGGKAALCCAKNDICRCDVIGCYRDAASKNCICGYEAAATASLDGLVAVDKCPLEGGVTCCQRVDLGHCWCAVGLQCDQESVKATSCAASQITCELDATVPVADCRAGF